MITHAKPNGECNKSSEQDASSITFCIALSAGTSQNDYQMAEPARYRRSQKIHQGQPFWLSLSYDSRDQCVSKTFIRTGCKFCVARRFDRQLVGEQSRANAVSCSCIQRLWDAASGSLDNFRIEMDSRPTVPTAGDEGFLLSMH